MPGAQKSIPDQKVGSNTNSFAALANSTEAENITETSKLVSLVDVSLDRCYGPGGKSGSGDGKRNPQCAIFSNNFGRV